MSKHASWKMLVLLAICILYAYHSMHMVYAVANSIEHNISVGVNVDKTNNFNDVHVTLISKIGSSSFHLKFDSQDQVDYILQSEDQSFQYQWSKNSTISSIPRSMQLNGGSTASVGKFTLDDLSDGRYSIVAKVNIIGEDQIKRTLFSDPLYFSIGGNGNEINEQESTAISKKKEDINTFIYDGDGGTDGWENHFSYNDGGVFHIESSDINQNVPTRDGALS